MGPDLQWIKRAQACGMSEEDIQAYLDAWAQPVPTVDGTVYKTSTKASQRQARWREQKRLQASTKASTETSTTGETIEGEVLSFEKEKKERSLSRRLPSTPSRFPDFKSLFPRRKGNYGWPKAEKKFNQLVAKGVPPDEIIEGVRRYATLQTELGKVGTEFIQMPTTWLNGEMWKDDTAAEASFEERYERARLAFRNGTPL